MIKRIIPVIVICSVLISAICFPAAAETIEDIYDPSYVLGSYYILEPTTFTITDLHIDDVTGLGFLKQYLFDDLSYSAAPSISYSPPEDEREDAFWDLFGYQDWLEETYSVCFNGRIYEDLQRIDYQCSDGTLVQLLGNPSLLFGDLREEPLFDTYFGDYDNGLPFLVVLTIDLPNVLGTIITDGIYGKVDVSVVCGIVPDVEPLDYNDYVSNTVVSDDLQTVTVTLPAAYSSTYVRTGDIYDSFADRYLGSSFEHTFKSNKVGVDNYVQHALFGSPLPISGFGYRGKALYVGNIPDGTVLNFTFSMRMKSNENWLYQPEEWGLSFRSAQIAEPGVITAVDVAPYEVVEMERDGDYFVMTVVCSTTIENLNDDTKWMSFDCGFGVGVVQNERSDVLFSFEDVELEFSISALAGMINESQRNNKLLKEVNRQLEEQGKTLNEILAGSSGMQQEADKITGDISNKVEQGNQLMDALDSVQRPNVGGSVSLPSNITTGTATNFNTVVAHLWNNDLIYQMMSLAGMVMLASYILFGKKV